MALTTRLLACGNGWSVREVVCTSGPQDRTFVEEHGAFSIALVTEGAFQYRTTQGAALMVPGSLLLGNAGSSFECGHSHGRGDRCLAFHLSPQLLECISAAVPGTRRMEFTAVRVPPLTSIARIIADVESMRDQGGEPDEYEEAAIRLAGCAVAALSDSSRSSRSPTGRDERRVSQALRWIEARGLAPVSIDALAAEVAMSQFHFLRVFEQVVGVTPGQYLLRRRLHRAATRLRQSGESIAAVALECRFEDLSTFNRQFRRAFGLTPGAYRAGPAATP
jgi:AraC family transcriptional regulator